MKTMYYSEKLKKYYDTTDQCAAAELAWDKEHAAEEAKKKEKAEAAKHVEELFKEAAEANKAAKTALNEFCAKYGYFHTSIKEGKEAKYSLFDLFDNFWF